MEIQKQANLKRVFDSDYCIACGACTMCYPGLDLVINQDKGMFEPNNFGNDKAAKVCPAISVDYNQLISTIYPGEKAGPLGVVRSVYLAQSQNLERNLNSSSGGIIKELMHAYIVRPDIDGIIALDHLDKLTFEPRLITKAQDIDNLPGSIYHNVSFANALKILSRNEGRFVLVANPCQLEGIYNYIFTYAPELAERIHTTIGLICGWTFSYNAIKAICAFKGINFENLLDISFRGGGPIGFLKLATSLKTTFVNRRIDFSYQVSFDRSFNLPRCHLCVNHTNFLADIVVGDAWLPSTVKTKSGISIVVCRRKETEQDLIKLKNEYKINLLKASIDDVIESQTRRVAFGDFAYAYAEYLKKDNRFCPTLEGPNRQAAKLVSRQSIKKFDDENILKRDLIFQRLYRRLWFRKITLEFGRFSGKYFRWFFVRILKVKSLFGQRKEISKNELDGFR